MVYFPLIQGEIVFVVFFLWGLFCATNKLMEIAKCVNKYSLQTRQTNFSNPMQSNLREIFNLKIKCSHLPIPDIAYFLQLARIVAIVS